MSAKEHKKFVLRLDADLGQIVWESVSKQQKISEWLLFLFHETRFGTDELIFTSSTDREYQGDLDGVGHAVSSAAIPAHPGI